MHSSLAELQSLTFQLLNQLLRLVFYALLRRNVYSEPRLALVVLLVLEPIFPLVQAQEYYLRDVQTRVVLSNDLLLRLLKRVLADDRLHIRKATARDLGAGLDEGLEFVEKEECGRRVVEGGREELVVGTKEAHAV